MYRYAALVLLLALGIVFQHSHGTLVTVNDKDGKLCLYADLMVNFSVSYGVADNKSMTAEFDLPGDVTADGSKCDTTSSVLKLDFGEGHSWSMNFTNNGKMYQADSITFSYNLSDTTRFPDSVSNETLTVTVKPDITNVGVDTCYSCRSYDMIRDSLVNQTLWNVLVQAFVSNNSKSEINTTCSADLPTTAPPTTHSTSTTTAAPVTNATTTATPATTTPTPALPTPTTGKYSIKPDENSTACLLANFGLRIGYKEADMNFDPNGTVVSGSCGVNRSELVLVSQHNMTVIFTFINDSKKFRLHALNVTGKTSSGVAFSEGNTSLSLWEASASSSYMCNKEQNYTITDLLTIYTFDLHVQAFGVNKGVFSTAEECFLDSDLSFLVPIAVGVALSFLIILVLISYLIGRRKSRTGYQSV